MIRSLIRSFRCKQTQAVFEGRFSRKFNQIADVAEKKLIQLHAALRLADLALLPGNRLEALRGDRSGTYSIRVNEQYRASALPGRMEKPATSKLLITIEGKSYMAAKGWAFRRPIHPGRVLKEDLLDPLGMSVNQLAVQLRVPANRLHQVVHGRRAITPDTSIRLGRYFGFSPEFWHNMQKHYEFELARRSSQAGIERQIKPRRAA